MLTDRFGRTINYMRISITEQCNLRCTYCMPHGSREVPRETVLTCDEITLICRQAVLLGIDCFKITGGEPLVRQDCAKLVRQLNQIPGVRQITLTTNGVLLGRFLPELLDAGLGAVNISLDIMDRDVYRAITGRDEFDRVLASIHQAAGQLPVKINCVVQRGINDSAPPDLALLAKTLPVDVRFIELMPLGAGQMLEAVPNSEILRQIESRFGKSVPDHTLHGNGPAEYRRLEGFTGSIGFISAVHNRFCRDCNRLRLMSNGDLKPCLCYGDVIPLKQILRDLSGDCSAALREAILTAVQKKPQMHCFERQSEITENHIMAEIGG